MKHEALEFLTKDYILNVDMIESINNCGFKIIHSSSKGVLICDPTQELCMISALDFYTAKEMIDKMPSSAVMIVGHQEFYYNYLKEKFNPEDEMICYQSVYTKDEPYVIENAPVEIKLLDKDYSKDVFNNYSNRNTVDIDYIEDRIKTKTFLGAFIVDKLAGFIGTHEEGSIGMLEVLDGYKGRGIGTLLQKHATNLALEQERIPYGQIICNNIKSINLQKKLGYEISKEKIYWLIRPVGASDFAPVGSRDFPVTSS